MVNNFLLLVFGDENPFDIHLLKVRDQLFSLFGGRTASSGGKPTRMGKWVATLSQKEIRWLGEPGSRRRGQVSFFSTSFLNMGLSPHFPLLLFSWLGALSIL